MSYLKILGYVEAASLLILLGVAMPLKYLWQQPDAVRYVGMVHGILFLLYIVTLAQSDLPWKKIAMGVVLSSVPFGPVYFHKKIEPANAQ